VGLQAGVTNRSDNGKTKNMLKGINKLMFENMVEKWIRPLYNSAIVTICYNIARDEPTTVNDPAVMLEMVLFDVICEDMLRPEQYRYGRSSPGC
jgi:hypothetical protein